jgi:hypothetical protein
VDGVVVRLGQAVVELVRLGHLGPVDLAQQFLRRARHDRHLLRPPDVRYVIEPGHLILGGRRALRVGAVIRQALDGTTVWLTTVDLTDPAAVAQAAVLAELHMQIAERPSHRDCLWRYAVDHGVHVAKSSSFRTRTGQRLVTMIANLVTVAVNRQRQTGGDAVRGLVAPPEWPSR